jgi:SAM-dependent methyltransferase
MQGDACNLDLAALGTFDVVMGANLLCRLPSPQRFLDDCATLVRTGGHLVCFSPFTWMEQFTPRCNWLGGYVDAGGVAVKSRDGIVR